jgi:hypothetical protein
MTLDDLKRELGNRGFTVQQSGQGSEQSSQSQSSQYSQTRPVWEPSTQKLNKTLQKQLDAIFGSIAPIQQQTGTKTVKKWSDWGAAAPEGATTLKTQTRKKGGQSQTRTQYSAEEPVYTTHKGLGAAALPQYDLATPQGDELRYLQQMMSLADAPLTSGIEQEGLSMLRSMTDLSGLTNAYRDIFEQIVAPEVTNRMIAQGYGGSGAVGEILAREGLPMALAAAQASQEARGKVGSGLLDYGTALESRGFNRANIGYQAAGVPRQAHFTEMQRGPGMAMTLMRGLPASVASGQQGFSIGQSSSTGSGSSWGDSFGFGLSAPPSSQSTSGLTSADWLKAGTGLAAPVINSGADWLLKYISSSPTP